MYSRKPAGWSIGLEGARRDCRRLDERLGQSDLPTEHEGPLERVRVPVLISSSVPAGSEHRHSLGHPRNQPRWPSRLLRNRGNVLRLLNRKTSRNTEAVAVSNSPKSLSEASKYALQLGILALPERPLHRLRFLLLEMLFDDLDGLGQVDDVEGHLRQVDQYHDTAKLYSGR